jgi:two-component system chemotaxis response regulator CheY
MKCLIVDDEVFCREFVAALLRGVANCDQASEGNSALTKYRQAQQSDEPYDLVILDIMMPGLSGLDTAKAIRSLEKEQKTWQQVNIIMLTALNSANDAIASFCEAQAASYLVKPVSKDGLFKMLSQLGLLKK